MKILVFGIKQINQQDLSTFNYSTSFNLTHSLKTHDGVTNWNEYSYKVDPDS